MGAQLGYDPGNFYIWRASDRFAIHLSLNVVTQLAAQISRAGSESQPGPPRGILLGRTIETPYRTTVIEDFKLIPLSEDAAGEPESEDALLEMACQMAETGNEQRVLGFFRARRDGTLNMRHADLQTFSRLFCATGNIALLIQTPRRSGESEAALFYWQHGGTYPRDFGFGFPLDAGQLAAGHPGWRYGDPLDAAEPVATPPPPPPPPEPPAPKWTPPAPISLGGGSRVRWSRLVPTAALVMMGIAAVQLATNSNRAVAAAAQPAEIASELGLTVASRPGQLEIRWNRESAAIADCNAGVMKITEAGGTRTIPFDQRQLQDGYIAYAPTTNDVSITLEVTGKEGTTSESVHSAAIP